MRISDWSSDVCSSDLRWAVRWGPLEEGELADGERLDAVIQAHRPTAVLHLAAYTAAGESVAEPGKYRSEERRVGKECVSTCRSRWSPSHYKIKQLSTYG